MWFLRAFLLSILVNTICYNYSFAQSTADEEEYTYDTTSVNVFEGADSISFKLDYYHTEGISNVNRYWYEVIVLDTLLILNFNSPESDTWNYISYQKRMVISDSALLALKRSIKTLGIKQKRKGRPHWLGSGYGADRLFIESKNLHLAAGTVFMFIGNDSDVSAYNSRIKIEKQQSSSIAGNYEKFFSELELLFQSLPMLKKDCNVD